MKNNFNDNDEENLKLLSKEEDEEPINLDDIKESNFFFNLCAFAISLSMFSFGFTTGNIAGAWSFIQYDNITFSNCFNNSNNSKITLSRDTCHELLASCVIPGKNNNILIIYFLFSF